jgi:HK97 family phage portal protein
MNDPAAIPAPGMFTMQRAGVPVTQHTALQVDVVFTALRVLSNAVIKMGDPRAYKWVIDDHGRPYKSYLPNQPAVLTQTFGPEVFQYDGRARTVVSLGLFGEAFWYILERDFYNQPRTVEVLHPAFVTHEFDKQTGAIQWFYGSGVNKKPLERANLIHIPFKAMPGATRGLSSLEFSGINYALALAALEYGQRWFAQGASPSYLLSTDTKLGTEEVKRIAEQFMVEHSGLQSAHLPLVLDGGLKAQKISSTPDEAQYLRTLEYARTCIAAYFGLPGHLVGGSNDKGNVWGKTVEEQGYQMVDFTLSGYIVPLEEAHGRLLPRGTNADFDEKIILRANAADRAAEMIAARTVGTKTKNEIRIYDHDLPPVEGGDDLDAPLNSNTSPAVGLVDADVVAKQEGVTPPTTIPKPADLSTEGTE